MNVQVTESATREGSKLVEQKAADGKSLATLQSLTKRTNKDGETEIVEFVQTDEDVGGSAVREDHKAA